MAIRSYEPVYDVTEFGVQKDVASEANTKKMQKVIDIACLEGGGVVYFPPGRYVVTHGLVGASRITLKGASLGNVDASSASIIHAIPDFPASQAVISASKNACDPLESRISGFQVENLSIRIPGGNPGIIGVDFSGVWYGVIRGVGILGELVPIEGDRSRLRPNSEGSIGFLFSDSALPCYANLVERTSVERLDTAYKFSSTNGNMTLNTLTNFWVADVINGVWVECIGGALGLTFRDGYIASTGLPLLTGKKAFKKTGDGTVSTVIQNVQYEYFDAPNDFLVGQLTSQGKDGFGDGTGIVVLHMAVLHSTLCQLVGAGASGVGDHALNACLPGVYPPPASSSFWAKLPAGQSLVAGENVFTYYTAVGSQNTLVPLDYRAPMDDMYFTLHVKENGGLNVPFQWSGKADIRAPYGYPTVTYHVSLYVPSDFTLSADLVFFLQANPTIVG